MARVLTTSSGLKLANFIGENWLIVTSFPNVRNQSRSKEPRMKSAAFIKRSSKSSLNSESLNISLRVAAHCLDCGKNRKILSVQQHPHLVVRTADLHVLCVPNRSWAVWRHLVIGICIWGRLCQGFYHFLYCPVLVWHIPSLDDQVRFIMFSKRRTNQSQPDSSRMMGLPRRAAGKDLLLADSCGFGKSNSRPQSKQTLYVRFWIVNTRLR